MNLLLPSSEWKNKPNKKETNHIPSLVMGVAHSCLMVKFLIKPHGVTSRKIVTVMRTSTPKYLNCNLLHGREKIKPLIFEITNVSEETTVFIQNYWFFGLFRSSGILQTRKHDVSETGSVSVLRRKGVRRHLLSWAP
jgi:hypothetical protein